MLFLALMDALVINFHKDHRHIIKYYIHLQTLVSKYIFVHRGKEELKLIAPLKSLFLQLATCSAFPFIWPCPCFAFCEKFHINKEDLQIFLHLPESAIGQGGRQG